MKIHLSTYRLFIALLFCLLQTTRTEIYAQDFPKEKEHSVPKAKQRRMSEQRSVYVPDSLIADSIAERNKENYRQIEVPADTARLTGNQDSIKTESLKEEKIWLPNSSRATWLAVVFPGAGQIYNRKYWKLPIIYGGFVGCAYALTWNNKMYKDYSQAYLDIMDNNPNTDSYLDFVNPNFDLETRRDWLKDQLKRKKDFYRRYRDLSIFIFIGVYIISIIDAYVDAELSNFDISKDLGLHFEPANINDNRGRRMTSVGLQCSITF